MVDLEALRTIYNGYTAVKKPGLTAIWSGSPRHADAAVASASHAAAVGAEATHADAAAARADALHAAAGDAAAAAGATHAEAGGAEATHAVAGSARTPHAGSVAAGLAVDAGASDGGSDGEYGVGAGAVRVAAEQRLSTRGCEVVLTNEDRGVVCHLRSLLFCTLKQRAQAG